MAIRVNHKGWQRDVFFSHSIFADIHCLHGWDIARVGGDIKEYNTFP